MNNNEKQIFIEVQGLPVDTVNKALAKEKGRDYWLYIVYGVKTGKLAILCIRNPIKRLPFRRKVAIEKREEYCFSGGVEHV